ncbi:MAG: hypothetical protein J6Y69_05325 [Treponema sp.]|nr:hypothetical protein [Treponema sp.]
MKKIITVLAALAVTTAAAFAGPAISVGGGFGATIEQQLEIRENGSGGIGSTTDIVGSPVFSVKGDFQWEKLGVAIVFDFNLNELSPWDNGTLNTETLYVTPYANLNAGDFNFNIGPLVGMRFMQDVDDYVSVHYTFILFGGSVNCNYKITDNLNVYLELPVMFNNMPIGGSRVSGGTTTELDFNYYRARLEVSPKMGLTYTF